MAAEERIAKEQVQEAGEGEDQDYDCYCPVVHEVQTSKYITQIYGGQFLAFILNAYFLYSNLSSTSNKTMCNTNRDFAHKFCQFMFSKLLLNLSSAPKKSKTPPLTLSHPQSVCVLLSS